MRGNMRLKLAIMAVALVAAIGYLAVAGVKGGWVYYVHVDQIGREHLEGRQRVRVHGKVGEEHLAVSASTMTARFELVGNVRKVAVDYRGAIPDLFKAGCDAVVEGKFDSAGTLKADVLMTKCASKYEEGSPHAGKKD